MSGFDRETLLQAPEGFIHEFQVPFQHVDAAGVVFFARVLDYFHDAYVAFLGDAGHPLHLVLAERRWAAPLVHAEADYMAPLRFGDQARCVIVRAARTGSKVQVGYRLSVNERPAAVGHTTHLWVDPSTMKRIDLPTDLAGRFDALGQ